MAGCPGVRLPATRTLAGELAVSRGVVVEAYRRLADEGLVSGRTGGGTRVLARPVRPPRRARTAAPLDRPRLPRSRLPTGEGIDLSPGVPDLSAFPRSTWLRAERAVLSETAPEDLGYGDPRGHPRLRAALAPWLGRTRGLRVDPDDILVVAGVAQAVALLAQQLRREGLDTIAVEDPGSRGAVDELEYWGLRAMPVPVDDEGIQVQSLGETGAAAVFLAPAHQFPTGVVLGPRRRRELLAWDGELVIEDDYDAEYRYDRAPVPALHPSAPERIAYAGSTSKTLAPALRLGWLVSTAAAAPGPRGRQARHRSRQPDRASARAGPAAGIRRIRPPHPAGPRPAPRQAGRAARNPCHRATGRQSDRSCCGPAPVGHPARRRR